MKPTYVIKETTGIVLSLFHTPAQLCIFKGTEADAVRVASDMGRKRKRFRQEPVATTFVMIAHPITREEHSLNTKLKRIFRRKRGE